MKKISILIVGGIIASTFVTSCQSEASQADIDAKVTEMYNEQKATIENEMATACQDSVNAKVAAIQDSLSHMNAKQQAALLAKTQRDLAAAKKKAVAKSAIKKPVAKVLTGAEKLKKSADDAFNSGGKEVQKSAAELKKSADDAFNSGGKEVITKTSQELKKSADDAFNTGGK